MHATQPPPDTGTPTPADTLRGVADYLTRNGWLQHTYYGGDGHAPAACLLGAISIVAYGFPNQEPYDDYCSIEPSLIDGWDRFVTAESALIAHLRLVGGQTVDGWNDHPARTAAEVVSTCRDAATAYELRAIRASTVEVLS